MQLRLLLLAAMASISAHGCANSQAIERTPDCNKADYMERINRTEEAILTIVPFREPNDLLGPGQRYACAILQFDISLDGKPGEPRVIEVFPTRIMADSAKSSIGGYRFKSSNERRTGFLLFEVSR